MDLKQLVSETSGKYVLRCGEDAKTVLTIQLTPDLRGLDSVEMLPFRPVENEEKELMLECVSSFAKAQQTMQLIMGEQRLVGSEKSSTVSNKKMFPYAIELISETNELEQYLVRFNSEGQQIDHTFHVSYADVDAPGITWDEQFWSNIDGELSLARPLFKAIATFSKLRHFELAAR